MKNTKLIGFRRLPYHKATKLILMGFIVEEVIPYLFEIRVKLYE